MTDHFTDEIFSGLVAEDMSVRFPISRLVLDPERFIDDAREPMAERGMGVIYTRGSAGQKLREPPSRQQRANLIATYYRPHHQALTAAVERALAKGGVCLVIDCHSFPSAPLPYEADQSRDRPDICIGTDDAHTPARLSDLAVKSFTAAGFHVALDRPFSGALLPSAYYKHDTRVMALMVEVNRGLYMDEASGLRLPSFARFTSKIHSVVRELVREGHATTSMFAP